MRITQFLFLLFLGLLPIIVRAQYHFDHWTTNEGLPQNSVYAILQTRDNYIWLATLDGLVRFDGVRFSTFNKSNTPSISNNRFITLYEDAKGDLWAGTEQNGVIRYENGRFTSYGLEQGLPSLRVRWITGDAEGNALVFPVAGKSIARWTGDKFVVFEQQSLASLSKQKQSQSIYCWDETPAAFNCQMNDGYYTFQHKDAITPRQGGYLLTSARDADGVLWFPTPDKGLLRVEVGERGEVSRSFTDRDGFPGQPIRALTGPRLVFLSERHDGSLWLTDPNTMHKEQLAEGKSVGEAFRSRPYSIFSRELLTIFGDREGNLWFGTTRSGLFRARRKVIRSYSTADGLTGNNVYPIFEDRSGVVWIGTQTGLFKYEQGVITQVLKYPGINAIGEDASGRLLFAAGGIRTLRNGQAVLVYDVRPTLTDLTAVLSQPDGTVWIGGQGGLARIKDGATSYFAQAEGLPGTDVKVVIADGSGGLWVGLSEGLAHLIDGKFTSWTQKNGLPSLNIRSLYQDAAGVLWIGTYDGGLVRFKEGQFTSYRMKDGLPNDGVFQILEDENRHFWISSNRGIYRLNRDELNAFAAKQRKTISAVVYGKSDGMLSIECNGGSWPAGIKSRDKRLWFPTQDGVAVIDPERVPVNLNPPSMAIEGFTVDGQAVTVEKLLAAIREKGSIEIGTDKQNFEIAYTALSFINSANLRFRYKLEGLDQDWIDAATRRTAYYSFVPPGSYLFRVSAANSDGIWNETGQSVRIRVLPPFYRTWWFRTLIVLALAGLGYLVFRIRLNRVEKARLAQEEFSRKLLASQEKERQRIAAELHDSLGQSLLIIKNRIALAQCEVSDRDVVEDQLTELSASASSAIEECRDIAYNLRPFQISRFGLSKTLAGLFARINEVTDIKAATEIDDIDSLLTDEVQTSLFRIVQECVNNIIKHSHATQAQLQVSHAGNVVKFVVKDNGRGFDPSANGAQSAGGFGLIGIAERVKMLNGAYDIVTGENQGTSIVITLSVSRAIS